ncbi:Hypothetical predicted protein [Paramuricea clavata]|uniref:Uncharacterized protein n=1 Tax=Paramuricea clavata TaxID=317549 RepID=A0A7D9E6X5_PARCT|nr:Hypothetical predicted protein [Paramuricea clavata]
MAELIDGYCQLVGNQKHSLLNRKIDDRRLPNVPVAQGTNGSQPSSENTSTRHGSVTSTTTQKSEVCRMEFEFGFAEGLQTAQKYLNKRSSLRAKKCDQFLCQAIEDLYGRVDASGRKTRNGKKSALEDFYRKELSKSSTYKHKILLTTLKTCDILAPAINLDSSFSIRQ